MMMKKQKNTQKSKKKIRKKIKFNLSSTRTIDIQRKMTERAIELLCLEDSIPSLVLDVGCGSGLSGDVRKKKKEIFFLIQ